MTGHPRLSNVEEGYDLAVLPLTDSVLTDKSSRRFYGFNLLFDGYGGPDPGPAG